MLLWGLYVWSLCVSLPTVKFGEDEELDVRR